MHRQNETGAVTKTVVRTASLTGDIVSTGRAGLFCVSLARNEIAGHHLVWRSELLEWAIHLSQSEHKG